MGIESALTGIQGSKGQDRSCRDRGPGVVIGEFEGPVGAGAVDLNCPTAEVGGGASSSVTDGDQLEPGTAVS